MATKTFEELKQLAIQIRDEKTNKQNTATRIGTQMLEHLNKLEQDYYDKTATDEELKQRDEKLTELSSSLGNKTSSIGYVTCDTAAGTAAKVVTVTGLTTLSTGIRLLVKMTNNNTASNATLNINSLGAKPLYYNNTRVSGDNAWVAGEIVDVYYDGTNFYSGNFQGGSGKGGNLILEWNTDAATTRKQVKQSDRKSLLQISYKNGDGDTINEQYIGTNYTDTEWEKDSNWEQIVIKKELDKTNTTIGDFFNSVAAAYGSDITKVLEYLSSSVEVILEKVNASIFTEVEWIDTIFGIGDNTTYGYNAWAPACTKYDETLGKVVFIQCHIDNHSSKKIYPSQVWAINPYDLLDEELLSSIECTIDDVPLSFDIYDGVYYLVGEKSTWKSTDHGKSFSKTTHNTLEATYGMQIIDGVMYVGNDNSHEGEIIYYTSSDFGETFEEHKLEDTHDGVKWSEVNFLKFKNNLYMCSRREDLNGLLFRQDGESWTLISDEMPNVSSDCHMYAADNVIAFGAIDRPNKKLILGTIEIGTDVKIDVKKEYDLKGYTGSGDFHTPSYVYNKDFQMITFMIGRGTEYQKCNNAAIVGYRNINTNKNVDYTWRDTGNLISNIVDEPYVGTKFDGSNVIKGNVYNLKNRMLQTYPLEENGDILYFYENGSSIGKNTTASWLFQTTDFINSKHGYISCLIRDPYIEFKLADPPYKMIFKAEKGVVANINDIGEIVPPDGEFNYVRYCQDTREGNNIPYAYRVAEIAP